jgi:hypothetical protein
MAVKAGVIGSAVARVRFFDPIHSLDLSNSGLLGLPCRLLAVDVSGCVTGSCTTLHCNPLVPYRPKLDDRLTCFDFVVCLEARGVDGEPLSSKSNDNKGMWTVFNLEQ